MQSIIVFVQNMGFLRPLGLVLRRGRDIAIGPARAIMKEKEHRFSIGRSRDCDVVLADDSVSRHHAELFSLKGGKLFLIDCHSRNGTALIESDRPRSVHQEFISPTDTLLFGSIQISVRELLEIVRLRFHIFSGDNLQAPDPDPPMPKAWVKGSRLVRCV